MSYIQLAVSQQNEIMSAQKTILQGISTQQSGMRSIMDSYQELLYEQNAHLKDVVTNTRRLSNIEDTLTEIKNNTSRL